MRHTLWTLRWSEARISVLLALTTWISHFWHYKDFGLYEDDLFRITRVMDTPWPKTLQIIMEGGGQGRPLHDGLIYALSFSAIKVNGIGFIYIIAWIIATINALLFYVLLKRISKQRIVAVTGALAFCLFPADTTQAFLTHSLGIQPSLMLCLLALHLYLSRKKRASYLLILGSLLCYETVYPVFLAAPLLKGRWNTKFGIELKKHIAVMIVILAGVVFIRRLSLGFVRGGSEFSILSTIHLSTSQMLVGPVVSLSMFAQRPFETALSLSKEQLQILPISFLVLVWVLSDQRLRMDDSAESLKDLGRLALNGLVMLILAYPFTLTVSANEISGRASRVHAAAVIGGSIVFACLCCAFLLLASAYNKQRLATLPIAGLLVLLLGFGLTVQQDYRLSWQYQRAFWTDVIKLCPDMADGTAILVETTHLKSPRQIEAHSWSTPVVLDSIYRFPKHWKSVPRLYKLKPNWQKEAVLKGNSFQLSKATENFFLWLKPKPVDTIETSNIILLQAKDGTLVRRHQPFTIGGQELSLKTESASPPLGYEKGPLYNYLIRNSDEAPSDYLSR